MKTNMTLSENNGVNTNIWNGYTPLEDTYHMESVSHYTRLQQ